MDNVVYQERILQLGLFLRPGIEPAEIIGRNPLPAIWQNEAIPRLLALLGPFFLPFLNDVSCQKSGNYLSGRGLCAFILIYPLRLIEVASHHYQLRRLQILLRLLAGHRSQGRAVKFGGFLLLRAEFPGRGQRQFVHPSFVRLGSLDLRPVALALQHLHQCSHPGLAHALAGISRLRPHEGIAHVHHRPLGVVLYYYAVLRLHPAGQ